ncbi:translesion error-prone DNA polymerase V autoproteolytic subunit [Bifidobacterium sp. B4001]|uniref:LexA family protein n=1 Tax=unclassified Bifidobacterium TaxID=2608897 RepID=UPI00226B6F44|nr:MULTISPECIES: S24 family peptidase [unclassified Bifidobacterium]MCX8672181.1 translesion error-prone DNA polymerase V autoproteolytic subunit [Bifidobacterium sp. B4079]MCX8680615.1 translesion error-prone DNA polymerase V autoproteolytic subunit [Bifidobacterium sp. B4001]
MVATIHGSPDAAPAPLRECRVDALSLFREHPSPVPQALEAVHAGFPSVAQDYFSGDFSFDQNVIVHPDSTFIIHVAGDSMTGAGIFDGDLLVVDRSLEPREGDIVIAILDDELLVKRLARRRGRTMLRAENPAYPDFMPQEGEELVIWGVVIGNYHWQRVDTRSGSRNGSPLPQVTYPGHTPRGPGRTESRDRKPVYPSTGWGSA